MTIEYLLDNEDLVTEEEAVDASFYRKYQNMPSATKAKIRKMVEVWDEDD